VRQQVVDLLVGQVSQFGGPRRPCRTMPGRRCRWRLLADAELLIDEVGELCDGGSLEQAHHRDLDAEVGLDGVTQFHGHEGIEAETVQVRLQVQRPAGEPEDPPAAFA
jgi:hypothetical protein